MEEFLQYIFSGLTNGTIYAVIAIGFSTLFAATDLINFAQGEFVMFGALCFMSFWNIFNIPLPLAFLLAVLVTGIIGVLFERLAIRPVRKPEPIVLIIITVGASIFFRGVGMLIWGKDAHSVEAFTSGDPVEIGGAYISQQSLWIIGIALLSVIGLNLFYNRTLTGKAMTACSINKKAASLLGIATERMTLFAFLLSGAMGGLAGVIISPITMSDYHMGTMLGIKGFCAAMLGGLGSFWGAVMGGLILGIMEAMAVGYISSSLRDAIAFMLLLLILYLKPTGIMGGKVSTRF